MESAQPLFPDRSVLPPPSAGSSGLQASFAISVDVERSVVRYVLAGFFDAAGVSALQARQAEALRNLRCGPNEHLTLLDISACRIQAQEMIVRFGRMLADPRNRSRKIAVVVGGSLARMQVGRLMARPAVAYFAATPEAEAWLLAGDDGSAGADGLGH